MDLQTQIFNQMTFLVEKCKNSLILLKDLTRQADVIVEKERQRMVETEYSPVSLKHKRLVQDVFLWTKWWVRKIHNVGVEIRLVMKELEKVVEMVGNVSIEKLVEERETTMRRVRYVNEMIHHVASESKRVLSVRSKERTYLIMLETIKENSKREMSPISYPCSKSSCSI